MPEGLLSGLMNTFFGGEKEQTASAQQETAQVNMFSPQFFAAAEAQKEREYQKQMLVNNLFQHGRIFVPAQAIQTGDFSRYPMWLVTPMGVAQLPRELKGTLNLLQMADYLMTAKMGPLSPQDLKAAQELAEKNLTFSVDANVKAIKAYYDAQLAPYEALQRKTSLQQQTEEMLKKRYEEVGRLLDKVEDASMRVAQPDKWEYTPAELQRLKTLLAQFKKLSGRVDENGNIYHDPDVLKEFPTVEAREAALMNVMQQIAGLVDRGHPNPRGWSQSPWGKMLHVGNLIYQQNADGTWDVRPHPGNNTKGEIATKLMQTFAGLATSREDLPWYMNMALKAAQQIGNFVDAGVADPIGSVIMAREQNPFEAFGQQVGEETQPPTTAQAQQETGLASVVRQDGSIDPNGFVQYYKPKIDLLFQGDSANREAFEAKAQQIVDDYNAFRNTLVNLESQGVPIHSEQARMVRKYGKAIANAMVALKTILEGNGNEELVKQILDYKTDPAAIRAFHLGFAAAPRVRKTKKSKPSQQVGEAINKSLSTEPVGEIMRQALEQINIPTWKEFAEQYLRQHADEIQSGTITLEQALERAREEYERLYGNKEG